MTDKQILDNCLEILGQRGYSSNDEVKNSLRVVARHAFERMMIEYDDLTEDEWYALRVDRSKLKAVKLFRDRHGKGYSLMDAKKTIEKHMQKEFGYTIFPYNW